MFISAVSWLAFQIRLKELISDHVERAEVPAIYEQLLMVALPATREVAEAAFDVRQQALKRLPYGDALIAATVRLHGATLVHRDPHMAGIPESVDKQIVLSDKDEVRTQGVS